MNISPKVVEKGAPEGSGEKRKPDLEIIKKLEVLIYQKILLRKFLRRLIIGILRCFDLVTY